MLNVSVFCLWYLFNLPLMLFMHTFLFYRIMYTVAQRIGLQLVIFHSHFSNKAVVKET